MINLKPGDVVIVNNWNGNFLSKSIRFFTKSWSHTALGFFPIVGTSAQVTNTVFEANLLIGITDWEKMFNDSNYDLRVYRWTRSVGIGQEAMCFQQFNEYNANVYGYWQLPYFIWRWICEGLHLPKRFYKKNFFPKNEICTEILYTGFIRLKDMTVNAILAKIGRDQFTVHPGDIIAISEELVKAGMLERIYNRER